MTGLFDPLGFRCGAAMPNRFMLAPLTNLQSEPDGEVSAAERHWLTLRAEGGFGAIMTAAAYVQQAGKGFGGQLGVHQDRMIPGLAETARAMKSGGGLAILQLYHGGIRSNPAISGLSVVGPSTDTDTGARAMTVAEIEEMIEAFAAAAQRAKRAGFDGVELHAAHSYLLCSFISAKMNRRTDHFGGSLEARARPVRAIIDRIRAVCGSNFCLGLRLSAERMGMKMAEVLILCQQLMDEKKLDYIDMSLWNVFKDPEESEFKGSPLVTWFAQLDRGDTRLGVAGNIRSAEAAQACLDAGADYVMIGRAAIPHPDFPERVRMDAGFAMAKPPFAPAVLAEHGVTKPFMDYLRTSFNFVAVEENDAA